MATTKSSVLGPDGRPFDRAVLAEEHGGPTVTGVRSILSGHPAAGLTPERLGRLLRESEEGDAAAYLKLAEDMEERDLHYGGVLRTRKLSVAQLPVTVVAAGADKAAIRAADLVRDWLAAIEFEDAAFDLMDGIGKGFSACELVWDFSGGEWRPVDIVYNQPAWFQFSRSDGRTLRLRDGSAEGADLAPYKWLIHRPKLKSGLAIRGGLARAAAGTGGAEGDEIDELVEAMLGDWQAVMSPLAGPVLAAVDTAKTPEDLAAAPAELAATDPQALTDMLARGGFTARLAGLTGGDDAP